MSCCRRHVLRLGVASLACTLLTGHTPYRQWVVYRQRHLLIGTSRSDPPTYPLGRRIAAVLAETLPESRARASRAPDPRRLASLLGTGQFQLALLSRADAAALQRGDGLFASVGQVAIHSLFSFGDYLLVCRPDFPAHHAYVLAEMLTEQRTRIPGAAPLGRSEGPIPVHGGARAYSAGESLPSPPAE